MKKERLKRIKLIIAYDGTRYCGWQIQPKDITVEGVLNAVLTEFLQEEIQVIGASRTDSGVHALGNVAVFDTHASIEAGRIADALNVRLPDDIIIQDSSEVALDFHPRYCDTVKTYEYTIFNAKQDNPITKRHHHYVYTPLDVEQMNQAAKYFIGEHDFQSFCKVGGNAKTSTREIYESEVTRNGENITFRIRGNGFLYNMVRLMAGTLIFVGRGKKSPEWVKDILEQPVKVRVGPKVPAKGLTLVQIEYL